MSGNVIFKGKFPPTFIFVESRALLYTLTIGYSPESTDKAAPYQSGYELQNFKRRWPRQNLSTAMPLPSLLVRGPGGQGILFQISFFSAFLS